jgi:hypothetical protein
MLESRTLLSWDPNGVFSWDPDSDPKGIFRMYTPSDIPVYNPTTQQPYSVSVLNKVSHNPYPQESLLVNEGKIVSGEDRAGDQWTITVHGPGVAIVTDISPNDGALDDNINTIQLIGTSLKSTYVTGSVVASDRVLTSGLVGFNQLIDTGGVKSVILNGFSLEQTIVPTTGVSNNINTGIQLLGGVQYLSFANIEAPVDTNNPDTGITVQIGDPSTPIKVQPTIVLNNIHNTVFNSTNLVLPPSSSVATPSVPNNDPKVEPTVSIIVNGQLKALDLISSTQDPYVSRGELLLYPFQSNDQLVSPQNPSSQRQPTVLPQNIPASQQFLFPIVTTTGRTSIQAKAVGSVNVHGAATNFTVSRASIPFQNGFSGLSSLGHAHFHGPTDAVGIDVNGPIKGLKFDKGFGNPTGVFPNIDANGHTIPQTNDGLPANEYGYAGVGLVSGQVTATKIGKISARPANVKLQTPSNPAFVTVRQPGEPYYIPRAGNAFTNALITTDGSINKVQVKGDLVNTEIKTGFNYTSAAAGLEGTRAPSKIGYYHQNGNLINSIVSATYRPGPDKVYGTADDVAGPGSIAGKFKLSGKIYNTGGATVLGNTGAGFYALKRSGGYLPPLETTSRPHDQTLIR